MAKRIKIVLAESVNLIRKSLVSLIESYDIADVIGEAENSRTLFDILKQREADIVLLDLEMALTNGKEALKILSQRFPGLKVIVLSTNFDAENINSCLSFGTSGYVSKNCSPQHLIDVIDKVIKTGFFIEESISNILLRNLAYQNPINTNKQKFTKRELEIIKEYTEGNTEVEISSKLNISIYTVRFHRMNIYSKSKTHNLFGLLNYLKENGIM